MKAASIEVEFRTTCVPRLVDKPELLELGHLLQGAPLWVLQQFVPEHSMDADWQDSPVHTTTRLAEFARLAEGFVARVVVRGI